MPMNKKTSKILPCNKNEEEKNIKNQNRDQ